MLIHLTDITVEKAIKDSGVQEVGKAGGRRRDRACRIECFGSHCLLLGSHEIVTGEQLSQQNIIIIILYNNTPAECLHQNYPKTEASHGGEMSRAGSAIKY